LDVKCHITQPSCRTEPGNVALTDNLSVTLLYFHSSYWLFIYLFYSINGNLPDNAGSLKSVFDVMTTLWDERMRNCSWSPANTSVFLYSKLSRPALRLIQFTVVRLKWPITRGSEASGEWHWPLTSFQCCG